MKTRFGLFDKEHLFTKSVTRKNYLNPTTMSISIADIVNSAEFKEALFQETAGLLGEILKGVADSMAELAKKSKTSDTKSKKAKPSPSKSKASPKSENESESEEPEAQTESEEEPEAESEAEQKAQPESEEEAEPEEDAESEAEPEEESSDSEEEQKPAPKGKSKATQKGKTASKPAQKGKSKTKPVPKGKSKPSEKKTFDFSTVKEVTIVNEGFSNKSFVILGEELRSAFPDVKTRWSDKLSTGAGLVVDKSLLKDVLAILKKHKVSYTLASKDEVTGAKPKTAASKTKSKTAEKKSKTAASKTKTAKKSGAAAPSKLKKNRWGNLEEVDNTSGVVYFHIGGSHVAVGTQDTGVKVSVKGLASVNGLSAEEKKDIEKRGFTVLTEELAEKASAKDKESLLDLLEPESEAEESEAEESEAEESEESDEE